MQFFLSFLRLLQTALNLFILILLLLKFIKKILNEVFPLEEKIVNNFFLVQQYMYKIEPLTFELIIDIFISYYAIF